MHNLTALSENTPPLVLVADLLYLIARRASLSAEGFSSLWRAKILVEHLKFASDHAIHVTENDDHYVVYAIEVPLVDVLLLLLDLA